MKTKLALLLLISLALLALAPAVSAQVKAQQFAVINTSTTVPVALTNNPSVMANSITIIGKPSAQGAANAATLYIGTSSVDGANSYEIASGTYHVFTAPRGQSYRLADFYIDVTSANDGVCVMFQ